jgi:hypothetical protein
MANTAWGALSWSAGTFGGQNDADVLVTGQSLTSVLNSVSISLSANVSLTGEQLSTSLNSVSFKIDGSVALTGNLANLTLNSVSAFPIILVPVTAPGTPTTWGASSWGSGAWGESIGLSLSQGTATVNLITPVNVTGQLLSTSLNSVSFTIDGSVALTGQSLTSQLSSVGITADGSVSIPVFENPLSLALGTVDPAPDAEVTGQQLTLSFNGNVSIDIAVAAAVTGENLTLALGDETVNLNTPVNITGQSLTLALNSVVTKLDVTANVTGNSLTGTTGQLYVTAWTPVDTGQSINWTPVAA